MITSKSILFFKKNCIWEKKYTPKKKTSTHYMLSTVCFLPLFLTSFPFLSHLIHVSLLVIAFVILMILCTGDGCSLLMAISHSVVAV